MLLFNLPTTGGIKISIQLLIGLIVCFLNTIFGAFWFFWASSGRSNTFNSIMDSIAKSKRSMDKNYSAENVKEVWQAFGFFFMIGSGILFIIFLRKLIVA